MPFQIIRNDISKMQVEAIVNTANSLPGYGEGIDRAIYEGAGEGALLAERRKIGAIKPGSSALTSAYRLPAKYIIHTVGTAWQGGGAGEEDIVRSCYRSVFRLALDYQIKSLAFPLLASGHYGFPKGIALRIALSEVERFMAAHDLELYLVVFDEKAFSLSGELYGDIESYISEHYAAEKVKPLSLRKMVTRVGEHLRGFSDDLPYREEQEAFLQSTCERKEPQAPQAPVKKSLAAALENLDKTFMELVFSFADAKGISDTAVQKRANLDRKAFSKLKCGTTKKPSKSTALALAITLELNLDDTRDLLSRAGFALSPCSKQDIIVRYFIEREIYDIYAVNVALFEHGEGLLGMQAS